MAVTVSRTENLHCVRPVFLDGAEIGGCIVVTERFSSRTICRFFVRTAGRYDRKAPWIFEGVSDMRARLPAAWAEHLR